MGTNDVSGTRARLQPTLVLLMRGRGIQNVILPGAVVLLIVLGWYFVVRQTRVLTQTTIAVYQQTELEIVRAVARSVEEYVREQVEVHGRTDVVEFEQEIFERFVVPVRLLEHGDAWIYAPDHVVFDLSADFPDEYRGKSMAQIFALQVEKGASHYEEMTEAVMNGREGVGWYIWLPDKGKEIAAWTPASVGEYTWTIGLSTPLPDILESTGATSQVRASVVLMALVTGVTLMLLYAWAHSAIQRQRADESLRQSEERYRTLVTQAPIGVVTCDRAGSITHVNPALLQILGSPSEEVSRQFNVLTMPNMVEAGMAADFRRCMEGATQITAEYPYCSYWGKESIVRLHMTPLRDESGAVTGALAVVEDVTEQQRLQEQLIQSAKLASIGELAAGVAHEINNPINGIINYAQLLLNKANEVELGGPQAPEMCKWLEGILREGDRVASIVHDLLTFARAEQEAHSQAHVPEILRATLTLTGQQLEKDGIVLEITERPDLPQVKCRSQRIQQVFLNLISNARSALNARYPKSDPNKRLTILIEQVEVEGQPYVRATFHDRGVGIPAHNLPRVFTPFFSTKRPGEGTGLGLSVSYGIVQDHHGDIQVESVEGEYTVFWVDLPVDRSAEGFGRAPRLSPRPEPATSSAESARLEGSAESQPRSSRRSPGWDV